MVSGDAIEKRHGLRAEKTETPYYMKRNKRKENESGMGHRFKSKGKRGK